MMLSDIGSAVCPLKLKRDGTEMAQEICKNMSCGSCKLSLLYSPPNELKVVIKPGQEIGLINESSFECCGRT